MAPSRNLSRRNRRKTAIIPLKPDYEEDSKNCIKHRRSEVINHVTEEVSETVPKLTDDATAFQTLVFFSAFTQARRNMQWTTGPTLFRKFIVHLAGTPLVIWEGLVEDLNQSVNTFNTALQEFKEELLQGYHYEDQMDYIRDLKKPRDETPSQFLVKVRASISRCQHLPDAPDEAGFSESEFKRWFLHAMPMTWQDKFVEANLNTQDETIASMRRYFDRLEDLYPYIESSSNTRGNGGNSNGNNSNNRQHNQGNRSGRTSTPSNGNNRTANRSNGSSNNSNNNNRVRNSDPCPVHPNGNHTWGECRANRYSNEQQQNRGQQQPSNRNNNNTNSNNNHKRNLHHNQQQDSNTNNSNNGNNNADNGNNASQRNATHDSHHYCFDLQTMTNSNVESLFYNNTVQETFEIEHYDEIDPTPTTITSIEEDGDDGEEVSTLLPITLAIAKQINDIKGQFLFKSLLDHGGSHVLVNKQSLPSNCELFELPHDNAFTTASGGMNIQHYIYFHDVILPEFSYTRRIKSVKAFVFDNPSVSHDIIFGRSFLNKCKIDVCSSDMTCRWYSDVIPFHPVDFFADNARIRTLINVPPIRIDRWPESNMASKVTATKDTFMPVDHVVDQQQHLTPEQRSDLLVVLQKYDTLFDGTLGKYPKRQFHIELKDNAVPYHCKGPYSVPRFNLGVLKDELDRQCAIGVLERVYESEWGMPLLVIPKKDGAIRTIDDFRELNKFIKRQCYPLPKIQDIFHRRKNYAFMTKLDLALCYYTYELDEPSSWLCVLVTPFGKFRRKRLPMGLTQSPDWAQGAIEQTFEDTGLLHDCVEAYIDDVGVFSSSWQEHLNHLDRTLATLQANGYTINPAKCSWCIQETDWLGHWLTPTGIKPWKKKVQGILAIDRPTTVTQLRSFIGMVNFYRDFWQKRAHIMAPLTALTKADKRQPLPWTAACDSAFQQVKAIIAEEVLLYYPDPNKQFIVEPDASKYQLGAVIYQMNGAQRQPVAFFSRKLTPAQTRYPPSDLEALCITEVFDEYRPILYGADILVRTDHKNLTARELKSQRLLHWRLLLEEFAPVFEHLPGRDNVVADTLSRLPLSALPEEEKDAEALESFLHECLLFYPDDIDTFPLNFEYIAQQQQNDPTLLPLADRDDYAIQVFHGQELICRRISNQWKIVLPDALIQPTLTWYHATLGHCGSSRLCSTIRTHFFVPKLNELVADFVSTCEDCQRNKFSGPGYGHLPPRNDVGVPWEEIAVDLIGPWKIQLPLGQLQVLALTIVDVTTTLSEVIRIDNRTSAHVTMQFENTWLARYPRPLRCVHDQGPEFVGSPFQTMLTTNGIQAVPTSVKNPQANAVCERMHKTVQDMLNTTLRHEHQDVATVLELIDKCIASAIRALRAATHHTMQISPGAIVFHRDMMLPIPILADYNLLRQRRQAVIDENNRRANLRRRFRDYHIDDQVLLMVKDPATLGDKTTGPFRVHLVHVNGTLTIERDPGIYERVNIRRLKPFIPRN